jgi:hypothetical protein
MADATDRSREFARRSAQVAERKGQAYGTVTVFVISLYAYVLS